MRQYAGRADRHRLFEGSVKMTKQRTTIKVSGIVVALGFNRLRRLQDGEPEVCSCLADGSPCLTHDSREFDPRPSQQRVRLIFIRRVFVFLRFPILERGRG